MAEFLCSRFSLLVLTLTLILNRARCEVFTALVDVEQLVYREREMRFTLEQYVNLEQERLTKLKNFLAKVNAAHRLVGEDVPRYLGHPVNSYLEIRRLYKEWPEAERLIQVDNSEGKCVCKKTREDQCFDSSKHLTLFDLANCLTINDILY